MRNMIRLSALAVLAIPLFALPVLAEKGGLDADLIEKFDATVAASGDPTAHINAISNNDINALALNRVKVAEHDAFYAHKLQMSSVSNQRNTGRCWIFAGENLLGPKVMTRLQLSDFELSHAYLTFWDKLEKANYALERIIETREKPLDDRSVQGILMYMFGDGGWWTYFSDLITKYGVVPASAMPETKQSANSANVNRLGMTLLKKYVAELRAMHASGQSEQQLRRRKEEMLAEVYRLLVYNYGRPPQSFEFRWTAKDDSTNAIQNKTFTPIQFYKEFYGESMPEYVAVVHNPAKPMNQVFQLEASRNVYDMPDMRVLNLPIERLKHYTLASLLDSQAVWFACDVGKEHYRDSAILTREIYQYEAATGISFDMNKTDRIKYADISPNHAMVITGVDTSATGAPVKWQVENSWGSDTGDKGYLNMYDDWFSEYVLLVMIDRSKLTAEDARLLDAKPQVIADWEPFFLALRNLE